MENPPLQFTSSFPQQTFVEGPPPRRLAPPAWQSTQWGHTGSGPGHWPSWCRRSGWSVGLLCLRLSSPQGTGHQCGSLPLQQRLQSSIPRAPQLSKVLWKNTTKNLVSQWQGCLETKTHFKERMTSFLSHLLGGAWLFHLLNKNWNKSFSLSCLVSFSLFWCQWKIRGKVREKNSVKIANVYKNPHTRWPITQQSASGFLLAGGNSSWLWV